MIAYLDCTTGVSGDKFLCSLIDAGFDPDILRASLRLLGFDTIELEVSQAQSAGVRGLALTVREPGAPRRHFAELRAVLEGAAGMPEPVRAGTLRALSALAEAEARVHGVSVDEVHFHEIGCADTLVDTLGVALGLFELGITEVIASPVATGSGTVMTEHGLLSVPAPATALLLEGMPIVPGEAATELTTPTGAALLAAHAAGFGLPPAMTLRRIGIGCGSRQLGTPNVCRLLLGEPVATQPDSDETVLLETNIDHLTPEELAHAADRLREGALDVWQTPIVMKKGRSATLLSMLVSPEDATAAAERMLAETGTLGVRVLPVARRLAERDVAEIETSLGTARFKTSRLPGRGLALRVESDDARRLAAQLGMPVDEVAALLEAEASRATGIQAMRQVLPSETTKPSD